MNQPDYDSDTDLEQQKQTDLVRAQARSVSRPIKKEQRHSKVDGRYIPPEEIKKEVEKLAKAKKEAADKKKNFFSRFFTKKQDVVSAENTLPLEKKQTDRDVLSDEEKKQKALQMQKLRGIAVSGDEDDADSRDFDADDLFEENDQEADFYNSIPQEDESFASETFSESVQRLSGHQPEQPDGQFSFLQNDSQEVSDLSEDIEKAVTLFAPLDQGIPDSTIATALSVAVGFIYWDEDGQLVDRIITVRRLFLRQGDILIDAFCHDISAPRLIPFSKGVRLYSLKTMAAYDNPRDFLLYHIAGLSGSDQFDSVGFAQALSVVRYELAALAFVAKSDSNKSDAENELMAAYVLQRCPTITFDENEMLDYISMLVPDEQSFFEAIEIVVKQPKDVVYLFVHTFMQMLLSDGILHENECELLAELLYLLQLEGIELSRIGLE